MSLSQCVDNNSNNFTGTLSLAFNTRVSEWSFLSSAAQVVDLDLSLNHTVDDGAVGLVCRTMRSLVYLNLEKTDVTSASARELSTLTQVIWLCCT